MAENTYTDSSGLQHINALDGLRGIAIIMVVIAHLFPLQMLFGYSKIAAVFLSMGSTGVDLFFVLSGFLITGILIKNKTSVHYFRAFYARRILRIFPLYYGLLFVFLVIVPVFSLFPDEHQFWLSNGHWFYYWLFLNNFYSELGVAGHMFLAVCWSLAIEEQYYLAWPLVVRHLRITNLMRIALACFLGSIALRWFLYWREGYAIDHLYHLTYTHLDGIALGSFLALLYAQHTKSAQNILALAVRTFPYLAIIVFGVWGLIGIESDDLEKAFYSRINLLYGWALSTLWYGSALVVALKNEGWLPRLLNIAILRRWGQYSYAIYLLHLPVTKIFSKLLFGLGVKTGVDVAFFAASSLWAAIAYFVLLMAVAYLAGKASWLLFECHINALKRHFSFNE